MSCGSERQSSSATSDWCPVTIITIANNRDRFDTRVVRRLIRTSMSSRVLQRGRERVTMAVEIDDLELELSSRMDDHAVDEHYMTRRGIIIKIRVKKEKVTRPCATTL